jgi:site-specific DNA-methyltransferase (adenine-specific)
MKNDGNKGIRNLNVRKDAWLVWEFDTEQECDNYINYLRTDFARFLLSVLKNTQNNHYGEMDLIPWLDFTEEWDDDKLFKKFNVSQELQDYIKDFLPDFHGIRK